MPDKDNGTNSRQNRIRDMMTERLVGIVETRREAAGDEPLGAFRKMSLRERKQLFAGFEEAGWDAACDAECQRLGLKTFAEAQAQGVPWEVPRTIVEFDEDMMKAIAKEAEGAVASEEQV